MSAATEALANGLGAVIPGGLGGRLFTCGVKNNEAAWTIAGGGRGEAGGGQRQVQQAALAGAHRREGVRLAGAADTIDGGFGGQAQFLMA